MDTGSTVAATMYSATRRAAPTRSAETMRNGTGPGIRLKATTAPPAAPTQIRENAGITRTTSRCSCRSTITSLARIRLMRDSLPAIGRGGKWQRSRSGLTESISRPSFSSAEASRGSGTVESSRGCTMPGKGQLRRLRLALAIAIDVTDERLNVECAGAARDIHQIARQMRQVSTGSWQV